MDFIDIETEKTYHQLRMETGLIDHLERYWKMGYEVEFADDIPYSELMEFYNNYKYAIKKARTV